MSTDSIHQQIHTAIQLLQEGDVIAYPTEAVFGLGCDPFNRQAVEKLLHVKQRPEEKGVILIAASLEQVLPMVELTSTPWESRVLETWPGPFTWVLPVKGALPEWVTGGRNTVAVRVSNHPLVKALCEAFGGPIVSTSANLSGEPPAKSCAQIKQYFKDDVYCIDAALGDLQQPTQIWDAVSNRQLR